MYVGKNIASNEDGPKISYSISCTLKTNDGLLYFLEKQMLFLNKPCSLIKYSDVEQIEYLRFVPDAHSGEFRRGLCSPQLLFSCSDI